MDSHGLAHPVRDALSGDRVSDIVEGPGTALPMGSVLVAYHRDDGHLADEHRSAVSAGLGELVAQAFHDHLGH